MAQSALYLRPRRASAAVGFHQLMRRWAKVPEPALMMVYAAEQDWQLEPVMRWLVCNGRPMAQGWRQPPGRHDRMCWLNSFVQRYVEADHGDDYAYAEGFAVSPEGGAWSGELHGWNLRRGHVSDRTYGRSHATRYWGVVFSDEFLRFTTLVSGYGFNLLPNFEQTWPYLDNYVRDWK